MSSMPLYATVFNTFLYELGFPPPLPSLTCSCPLNHTNRVFLLAKGRREDGEGTPEDQEGPQGT